MRRLQFIFLVAIAAVALGVTSASATMLSIEAADNATVLPAGPRPAPSGKAFFNIEGSGNTEAFRSYGVADFNFGSIPTVTAINSAALHLTQDLASFSADGDVTISLDSSATLADIQEGTSPLAFDVAGGDPGTAQDVTDGDLDLEAFTGTYTFTVGATGDLDMYTLGLSAAQTTELLDRLNAGDTIRVVIGTGTADVAATWSGATNNDREGPTLVLDVDQIPEPATLILAGFAMAVLGGVRRR
jgi:hypothetical protein